MTPDAEHRCAEPGCRRAPDYPDQRFCREHRLRWQPAADRRPAWVERMAQNSKDFTERSVSMSLSIRGMAFSGIVAAIWGMSLQNADYFGLSQPWGFVLLVVGAFLIGIVSPNYQRSGA